MIPDLLIVIETIFYFIIGCCFGSFINVIVHRLPLEESIISPPSHCSICKYRIHWFDNIPLISWFFLRGKCRKCNKRISLIYPFVELVTGLLFVLSSYSMPSKFGVGVDYITTLSGWVFFSILLVLGILDLKYFWLPDSICKVGILSGIFSSVIIGIKYAPASKFLFILEAIIAALIGYLIFQFISAIGLRVYKKPAMGKGDSKLTALIGSWLGIKGLGITILLAFYIAGIFVIIGLISKKLQKSQKIPFGIFLALSGMSVWHFGNSAFTKLIYLGTYSTGNANIVFNQ